MALNSIAVKQIVGAWGFKNDDSVAWMCSQCSNLQITQDGETTSKLDANGSTIFTIDRNKSCQISFDSSVLDLSILCALNGVDRVDATSESKIRVPFIQRFTLSDTDISNGYITLSKDVVREADNKYQISFHTLTTDGSLKNNYAGAVSADATHFSYNAANDRITLPVGGTPQAPVQILSVGDRVEVIYEFETESGVLVANAADKFPNASKVRFLVLAVDLCQQDTVRALWITAKNAKPQTGNTISLNLEDSITVTLDLAYSYCDESKDFYEITVADEDFVW